MIKIVHIYYYSQLNQLLNNIIVSDEILNS